MGIILQFQGVAFAGPLNPLKTDVSRGSPGLSGGPGPLGPHRNSTTGQGAQIWLRKKTENNDPGTTPGSILPSMRYCIRPVCHTHTITK